MNSKVLIIGPWVGEFSYELCWWVPKLRKIVKEQFPNHHVICFSYMGRYGLYRDFVHQFVYYDKHLQSQIGSPNCGYNMNKQTKQKQNEDPAVKEFFNNFLKQHNIQPDVRITSANINKFTNGEGSYLPQDTYVEEPYGNYTYLDASPEIHQKVKNILNISLDNNKNTVAIMARTRLRSNFQDLENWNPQHWKIFVDRLIKELDLNVVLIGVPARPDDNYPGALSFEDIPGHLYSMVCDNEHAVESQIAVLKNTKCSIYGASGAVYLTYFTNTPAFCFHTNQNGYRLDHKWCLKLTHNHEKIRILRKHTPKEYYDVSVDEVFTEFKDFYEGIK